MLFFIKTIHLCVSFKGWIFSLPLSFKLVDRYLCSPHAFWEMFLNNIWFKLTSSCIWLNSVPFLGLKRNQWLILKGFSSSVPSYISVEIIVHLWQCKLPYKYIHFGVRILQWVKQNIQINVVIELGKTYLKAR